jgi:hypothetical protein
MRSSIGLVALVALSMSKVFFVFFQWLSLTTYNIFGLRLMQQVLLELFLATPGCYSYIFDMDA